MRARLSIVPDCVAGYAARLHATIGTAHHAASPLGAWLLLALAGPAARGTDGAAMTEALGCDIGAAAAAAAELLANPHPLVASAAAVWTTSWADLPAQFDGWQHDLPPQVARGLLPDQAGLDRWARDHTFGLVDTFPVELTRDLYLVLATALATRVSWLVPFDLAPADQLGPASPWRGRVSQVLRTPRHSESGHVQFIAVTPDAGDVAVHIATAAGGLLVVSVAAAPEVPARTVLAAAHRIGARHAAGLEITRRGLAELPLGDGPCWQVRTELAESEHCTAVLPAWSASSVHDLGAPVLGFAAAAHALTGSRDPWQARQAVQARYSRTGFEAAAVSTTGVRLMAMRPRSQHRVAELRFAHPYAVVAVTAGHGGDAGQAAGSGPWRGLPVFSAWVAEPAEG